MAPKDHKLGRLRQLQAFVRDPVRFQELRGRSGDTLKAKLRQKVPGERAWYDFLHRTRFDADEQRCLDELNNLVTCRYDGLIGTSYVGASTAMTMALDKKRTLMEVSSGKHSPPVVSMRIVYKIRRLRQLQTFVCDPVKLQVLRGRSGDTLKAKLRQKVPGELTWYSFLHRARFDADEQRVLDELNLHGYMQTIWLHAETMTLLAQVMVVLLQP